MIRNSVSQLWLVAFTSSSVLIAAAWVMWVNGLFEVSAAIFCLSILALVFSDIELEGAGSYKTIIGLAFFAYSSAPFVHIGFEGNKVGLFEEVFAPFLWGSWVFLASILFMLPRQSECARILMGGDSVPVDQRNFAMKRVSLYAVLSLLAYLMANLESAATFGSRAARLSAQGFGATFAELSVIASVIVGLVRARIQKMGSGHVVLVVLLAYVCFEAIMFGDRRTAFSLLAAAAAIYLLTGDLKLRLAYAGGVLLLLPVVLAFGVLRAHPPEIWLRLILSGRVFDGLTLANTELGASARVANVLGANGGVFDFNPSYHLIPIQLIPGTFLEKSTSMLAPGQAFAYNFDAKVFLGGGGFGYNILLESFQNVWIFGPIALAGILTVIIRLALKLGGGVASVMFSSFVFASVFLFRYDLLSWFQSFLYVGFIAIVFYFLSSPRLLRRDRLGGGSGGFAQDDWMIGGRVQSLSRDGRAHEGAAIRSAGS